MALPKLTDKQRKEALEKAAKVRKERAELREGIKAGKITVAEVLAKSDDPVVGRMKVSMFLESLPGFGKAKTDKLMKELDISPSRRIKGLGTAQREVAAGNVEACHQQI